MQSLIRAGDTLDFETTVAEYPSTDGWTLKYRLTPTDAGGTVIEFDAATYGDHYRVQIGPGVTETWGVGIYEWAAWVTPTADPGAEIYTVDAGECKILPDPRLSVAGTDSRSPARIALEACDAALAAYGAAAFSNVAEYTIAGRSQRFRGFRDQGDFLAFRSQLKAEVWRESAAAQMKAGMPNPRAVRVRLARA